jgi:prevent-host-death family protein
MKKRKEMRVAEAAPDYAGELRIPATVFKARCLELIEQVRQSNQSVVITRHGEPVAVLAPYKAGAQRLLGYLSGSVLEAGDLVSPTGESWNAERGK